MWQASGLGASATDSPTAASTQPLDLAACIEMALQRNPAVLTAREELRRTRGIVVETRAQAIPQITAQGEYRKVDEDFVDSFPGTPGAFDNQTEPWRATVELSQLVWSGGRVQAAIRAARLSDKAALLDYHRIVAQTILDVRRAFYLILLNQELVAVREQSLRLLTQQLADARHRFEVGAVPQFNVLRAEVELANAKPPLIRARNDLRLSKEALARLLAIDTLAAHPLDSPSFTPVGKLEYERRQWTLEEALQTALSHRPELEQAETRVRLQRENVRVARAGYHPEIAVFADYGIRNATFSGELDETIHGWSVGARARWNLFDGLATHGRVQQAAAQLQIAEIQAADTRRAIELEVRQAYSDFIQAVELLEAQKKTVEQAEESLRLAEARFRAGSGTQLEVLSAQTALTEARSNEVRALYDYNVAVATMERVMGVTVRWK